MAISKNTILRISKDVNEIPVTETMKTHECYNGANLVLHTSYELAVAACSIIYLHPGEAHTEFYYVMKNNAKEYHCVIAIGNFPGCGKEHLYLEDYSNGSVSLNTQITQILAKLEKNEFDIDQIKNTITEFNRTLASQQGEIDSAEEAIELLNSKVTKINNDFAELNIEFISIKSQFNLVLTQVQTIQQMVEKLRQSVNKNSLDIDELKRLATSSATSITSIQTQLNSVLGAVENVSAGVAAVNNKIDQEIGQLEARTNNKITITKTEILSIVETSLRNINVDLNDKIDEINDAIEDINYIDQVLNVSINKNLADIETLKSGIDTVNVAVANLSRKSDDISNNLNTMVSALNTSINLVSRDLNNKINNDVNALDTKLSNAIDVKVNEVSTNLSAKIDEQVQNATNVLNTRISNEVEQLSNNINEAKGELSNQIIAVKNIEDAKIENLSNTIDAINEDLDRVERKHDADVETINNTINTAIDTLNTNLTNSINNKYNELSTNINTINSNLTKSIKDLSTNVDKNIQKAVENVKAYTDQEISKVNATIEANKQYNANLFANIQNDINDLNDNIEAVNTALDNKANELNDKIDNNVNLLNNTITNKVNELNDKIDNNVNEINDHISQVENNIITNVANINTSINEIKEDISKYISDPSIKSLFDKDIYTVNLCCWTPAGHVEISDNYITDGQYRTYVAGDDVSLLAVRNTGYIFKYWTQPGTTVKHTNAELDLTFVDRDFNVIATTIDDAHAYDTNKYVAVFARMHKIITNVKLINQESAELSGDTITIIGASENPYFEDGSNINIIATAINKHEFKYMTIDGERVNNNSYIINNAREDHEVVAYFMEERYRVIGEPNVPQYGDVKSNKAYEVLTGTTVTLTAIPVAGYEFVNWTKTYDPSVIISTDVSIEVTPSKTTGDIQVVANFRAITQ